MNRITCVMMLLLPMTGSARQADLRREAAEFLSMYNTVYQKLQTVSRIADWKASTDVAEEHTGERIGADHALAVFAGSTYVIEKCRNLLAQKENLDQLSVRQLEKILLNAAEYPGTIPGVVEDRVAAEANQSAILDGF